MAILRDLLTRLDADSSKFLRGFDQATNAVQRFEQNTTRRINAVGRAFTGLGGILAGAAALGGIGTYITRFADATDELGKFSARIGDSIEDLSRLGYVAELSGVSMETLNNSLRAQSNRIGLAEQGNEAYIETLERVGISVEEIAALDPSDSFLRIVQGMEGVEDASERVAIAQRLWGAQGTALLQIVDAGTESINEMMQEADALGRTLSGEAAQDAAAFNDAISRLTSTFGGMVNSIVQSVLPAITWLIEGITSTIQVISNWGRAVANVWDALLRTIRDGIGRILNLVPSAVAEQIRSWTGLSEAIDETSDSARDSQRVFDDTLAQAEAMSDASRVQTRNLENNKRAIDDIESSTVRFNDSLEKQVENLRDVEVVNGRLVVTIRDNTDALDDYRLELEQQLTAYDLNQEKIAELVAWYERLDPEDRARQLEFFRNELRRLGDDTDTYGVEAAERWENALTDTLTGLIGSFSRFWDDIISGNRTTFGALRSIALETLQDIIDTYATQPIVASIQSSVAGLFGGGPSGGAAGGGGLLGGIIGNVVSGLSGLLSGVVGGLVSTGVGSLLGSLLGDGEQRVKESQLLAGNFFGGLSGPLTISTPSPFGPDIGFGFNRIGNEGQLSNQDAADILETLESASQIIVGIDELIISTLDSLQVQSIGERINNLRGSLNYDPANVDQFIERRFELIFGSIDEALGEVFASFSENYEADELLRFAADFAGLQDIFARGGTVFTDVSTAAETITLLLGDMAVQGEALSDVLQRISAANGILGVLGLTGETAGGAAFNLDVLGEFGGDLGRLNELVSGFFDNFFTEAENLERRQQLLEPVVSDLLGGLGVGREGFAQQFLESLEEGLLSPEQVATWLEASEVLAELISLEDQLTAIREGELQQAREAEITAINAQIDVLRNSAAAIGVQIDAQRTLRAEIEAVSATIDRTFGAAIENIQFSILDREGQAQFLEDQIDSLTEGLGAISDPAELQRVLDEISGKTLQFFNLFDPETQRTISDELIEDLRAVQQIGQERLTELDEIAHDREMQLLEEQRALEEQIAEQIAEAAALQAQSTLQFSESVTDFALATQTPQTVQVIVDAPSEIGAA